MEYFLIYFLLCVCISLQLTKFPSDLNEAALSIHMGSKLDKAENFFTKLAPDNFTKFVHLQVRNYYLNHFNFF